MQWFTSAFALTEEESITHFHGRSAGISDIAPSATIHRGREGEMIICGFSKPFQEIIVSEHSSHIDAEDVRQVPRPSEREQESILIVFLLIGFMEVGALFCAFSISLYRNIYSFGFLQSGNILMWLDSIVVYVTIPLAGVLYLGAAIKLGEYYTSNPAPPTLQSIGIASILMGLFIFNYSLLPPFRNRLLFFLPFPLSSVGVIAITSFKKRRFSKEEAR